MQAGLALNSHNMMSHMELVISYWIARSKQKLSFEYNNPWVQWINLILQWNQWQKFTLMLEDAVSKVLSGTHEGLTGCLWQAMLKCSFPEMWKCFQSPPSDEFTPLKISFLCQYVCKEVAVRVCLTLLCTVKGEYIVDI